MWGKKVSETMKHVVSFTSVINSKDQSHVMVPALPVMQAERIKLDKEFYLW